MRKPFYWKARKLWYYRYYDEQGQLKTAPLSKKKKEAYDLWRALTDVSREAVAVNLTAVDIVDLYVAEQESRLELKQIDGSTVSRRNDYLSSFCGFVNPRILAMELKPYHVNEWLTSRERWNATTRYHAAEAVKSAFKWAVDEGRLPRSPITTLKLKKGASRDFVVSQADYELLLDGASDHRAKRRTVRAFKHILMALRLTGCRPGELTKVTIEHFDGETWTIDKHKNRRKQKKPRVVYLCPCAQTLTRILAAGRTSGPVFRPHPSRPWQYSDMRRRFERLRKRKEVSDKCVMYSFRHTWITNAMVATGDVATVAEMAGTSIQMIERHYGHLGQRRGHMLKAAVKIAKEPR